MHMYGPDNRGLNYFNFMKTSRQPKDHSDEDMERRSISDLFDSEDSDNTSDIEQDISKLSQSNKELPKDKSMSRSRDNLLIVKDLSLIHICRCRRYAVCRSRWSPYH
eukprot:TRINITY_DN7450_c0_g1_i1.p2 TRINITY_DN7450_c0_g1~~TRINITY_DN7450_c0_g1_i1.p2  ORF type:complete len:107 (+),score=9.19 TRINITY_DN7450_c0_g1_i1:306-626(+)